MSHFAWLETFNACETLYDVQFCAIALLIDLIFLLLALILYVMFRQEFFLRFLSFFFHAVVCCIYVCCIYLYFSFSTRRRIKLIIKRLTKKSLSAIWWTATVATAATYYVALILTPGTRHIRTPDWHYKRTSAASAVWQLSPAVRTSPPVFDVRSSGLLWGWSDRLELVTWHCSWSVTFVWQFPAWFKHFSFLY